MRPNNVSETKRISISVHLITFTVLVVVAIIFAGCANRNDNSQRPLTQQTASPSPSPSPSASPELVPGDTIIVIKDGSVEIEVNLTLCQDVSNPSQPNTSYRCDNIELDKMEVKTNGGIQPSPKPNPTSKITVDGGGGKEIVVKGNPRQVKIDFKKSDYAPCGPGKHCGTNKVGTITMDTPPYNKHCEASEGCKVTLLKK